ncbi:hypothetical protein ACFL34_05250, partial [Candidatus Sumerlaeota bacterium]
MGDKQTFQHVPGWLARRFALIAALEDNVIYLRESGRRYRAGRRRFKAFFSSGMHAALTLGGGLLLGALIVALVAFLGCFGLLLAFPLVWGLRRVSFASRLAHPAQMALFLEREWEAGRLPEIWLTSLSGTEVLWGYGGRFVLSWL